MPEVNIHKGDGELYRLTRTDHDFNEKTEKFETKQVPVLDDNQQPLDKGGFETDAEAFVMQGKAMKVLREQGREGAPDTYDHYARGNILS